jgi:hypothetical protein
MMGRTGKALPPRVEPPGSFGGSGVSLDNALVALVGVGAPLCDTPPATAPHPSTKTNKPAPAPNVIAVLPVLITTPNSSFPTATLTAGAVSAMVLGDEEPALEELILRIRPIAVTNANQATAIARTVRRLVRSDGSTTPITRWMGHFTPCSRPHERLRE